VVRDVPGVDDVAAQLADLLDLPEDG
jgi:hypothetical protein